MTKTGRGRRGLTVSGRWLAAGVLAAILALLLLTFPGGLLHQQAATPLRKAAGNALPAPDAAAQEAVTGYARFLVGAATGGRGDPFALDAAARTALGQVISALGKGDPVVVYNGGVHGDIAAAGIKDEGAADGFYLKPAGGTTGRDQYLPVISMAKVSAQGLLDAMRDPLRRDIVRAFNEELQGTARGGWKAVLEQKVREGTVASYAYDATHDILTWSEKGSAIPTQLHPRLEAQVISYLVRTYANPLEYAQSTLGAYRRRLAGGDVLLVDTRTKPGVHEFFGREALADDLRVLADEALTKAQKIERLLRGIRFQGGGKQADRDRRDPGGAAWAGPGGEVAQLLDRSGVIVPPSRKFAYLRGPDYIVPEYLREHGLGRQSYEMKEVKGRDGVFSAYWANDYLIQCTSVGWGEPFVERLAGILADESATLVYFRTHGGNGKLLAEVYDLGAKDAEVPDAAGAKAFEARVATLKQKYGADSIGVYRTSSVMSPEDCQDMMQYAADLPERLRGLLTETRRMGGVTVTRRFFETTCSKKSLFVLRACYGGSMAPAIKARVILSPSATDFTSERMFVQSDLAKIAPYLYKRSNPGALAVTRENMRNYNIVASFHPPPTWEGHSAAAESRQLDTLVPQKDSLCSIQLGGTSGQTISPAPHVEQADGSRVVCNAPLDTSVPAHEVVTLNFDHCAPPDQKVAQLKPAWTNDRELSLPWKDKVYRDWQAGDLDAQGLPNVPYVTIIVHADRAVSQLSRIPLTGNPDACTPAGARVASCWRDATEIRYNGNRPRTDFIFFRPALKKGAPEVPRVISEGDYVKHVLLPTKVSFLGDGTSLEMDGSLVIDYRKSREAHQAFKGFPNPVPIYRLDGGGLQSYAAFGDQTAWVRQTAYEYSTLKGYEELFHNGAVIFRGEDRNVTDPQLFGSNISYYTSHKEGTQKGYNLHWNGTQFDVSRVGRPHVLSTTSILSVNDQREVVLNGQVLGVAGRFHELVQDCDYYRGNGGVFLFRDNAVFIDANGHGRVYMPKRADGTADLGKVEHVALFGNHVVCEKRRVYPIKMGTVRGECSYSGIVYDGKEVGPGEDPYLYGDHLAFFTTSDAQAKVGPCYGTREPVSSFTSHRKYIYVDGVYHDVEKKLKMNPKTGRGGYHMDNLRIFDHHIAFVLRGSSSGNPRLIYDWKDQGECLGTAPLLFQDHLLFERKVGDLTHFIYDGKDLGAGNHAVIYGSHVAFSMQNGQHYADGRVYPEPPSVHQNIQAAYRYYLENDVKCSPYGTVHFGEGRSRASVPKASAAGRKGR